VPLRLEIDPCTGTDQALVRRLAALELGGTLDDEQPVGTTTVVHADCRDAEVQVVIDDPVTGKMISRTLDLPDQPRDARSRLLGLAISEAVLASWAELAITPVPAAPSPGTAASPDVRRQATQIAEQHMRQGTAESRDGAGRWQISAGPDLRWFGSGLVEPGLALRTVHWLQSYSSFGAGLDLDLGFAEASVADTGHASATGLSVAPLLAMRTTLGRLLAAAGVGWRLGLVHLAGEPVDTLRAGRTAFALWTGPLVALDLEVRIWRSAFVHAGVESGLVLLPARGTISGVRVLSFEGSWVRGVLSLGMSL
jgi:hypothetical protein